MDEPQLIENSLPAFAVMILYIITTKVVVPIVTRWRDELPDKWKGGEDSNGNKSSVSTSLRNVEILRRLDTCDCTTKDIERRVTRNERDISDARSALGKLRETSARLTAVLEQVEKRIRDVQ